TQLLIKDALVVNGQLQRAFDWPVRGRISSNFGMRWGRMHNGLDVAVVTGTPVRAAADGRVTFSGSMGDYGLLVIIDHGNSVETRYAHNSRLVASVGQQVKRGDIIAYSGNTGNSTGPHLHFEIRYRNTPVDPVKYLKN
ncbi:MAG: M23 family metallopeptidase, partial [Limnochordia bacterium]